MLVHSSSVRCSKSTSISCVRSTTTRGTVCTLSGHTVVITLRKISLAKTSNDGQMTSFSDKRRSGFKKRQKRRVCSVSKMRKPPGQIQMLDLVIFKCMHSTANLGKVLTGDPATGSVRNVRAITSPPRRRVSSVSSHVPSSMMTPGTSHHIKSGQLKLLTNILQRRKGGRATGTARPAIRIILRKIRDVLSVRVLHR